MNKNEKQAQAHVTHKANMAASLRHRMEVARANNDAQLLAQLEREMQVLGLSN